jgi:hypothetical protein
MGKNNLEDGLAQTHFQNPAAEHSQEWILWQRGWLFGANGNILESSVLQDELPAFVEGYETGKQFREMNA